MKKRIIGIDVVRALAVFGMIIVNFKIVFGQEGNTILKGIASLFEGKAAAVFVVLAGIGIALMSNSAVKNNDSQKLNSIRIRLIKRAIFLFIAGLSYYLIWPADILHFYGVYMLLTVLLLRANSKVILTSSIILICIYPVLNLFLNYEQGWNFSTFEYLDFWTVKGFFRNLLFNGFHPVIPWTSFMITGLWLGKKDLTDTKYVKKSMVTSLIVFVFINIVSILAIKLLSDGSPKSLEELGYILGTHPMPPLPIYMISGISFAIFAITASIIISEKFADNIITRTLNVTGQHALTFYAAHVIIGMGAIEIIKPDSLGQYSITFSFVYAILFSLACIVFSLIWSRKFSQGPLEWLMRKITA